MAVATASLTKIGPQPGAQTAFLATAADIAIGGGSAGGGKTFAELLEPLRHTHNPGFSCVIFRRTTPQIRNPGGLWDKSMELYSLLGATPKETTLEWTFPGGALVKMAHMEYEGNKLDWHGSEIPLIEFDELTHFTESQFFYMLSRNRSLCGVRPYVRATCNPDADSWVARLIAWWIGPEGYAIPERAGVIRWFVRVNDQFVWGDSPAELAERYPEIPAKSLTFIPMSLFDNRILMERDPGYLANLMALPLVERERLLGDRERGGNWKIRQVAGNLFKRHWFEIVAAYPRDDRRLRYWDLAATETKPGHNSDPDYTVGALVGEKDGVYYILDIRRIRATPKGVEDLVQQTAQLDGNVQIWIEQEPGASGVNTIDHYQRVVLRGHAVRGSRATGSKVERAKPVSAAAEAGNVKLMRGPWIESFLAEAEAFPDGAHDDQVDAVSGAMMALAGRAELWIS